MEDQQKPKKKRGGNVFGKIVDAVIRILPYIIPLIKKK